MQSGSNFDKGNKPQGNHHDRELFANVNTYSNCSLAFEVFNERGIWNLIICKSMTVGFNLKAQNKSVLNGKSSKKENCVNTFGNPGP